MSPRLRRDFTDDELRAVARWVVRTYLEIEAGHRNARALRRLLAPHLYFALDQEQRRPGARPVAVRDVGGALFNRVGAGKGYAVVVVREQTGRWSAITVVMRRSQTGSWQVVELHRVHDSPTVSPDARRISKDDHSNPMAKEAD